MPEAQQMRQPQRKCVICKALIDEEDLFCANCGAEAPQADLEVGGHFETRQTTRNFSCGGCGASMSYDASAQALRCPFCGSERMEKKDDSKTVAPRRVVPLAIDKQQADQITRRWLGAGWLRPSDLSDAAVITKMAAVYVPYWVFTAHTATYWTADTSQTPLGARGDWFPLAGEHHGSYSGVLIGASGALTPQETHALCPFHLNAAQPPEQVDLENVIVEQFNVPRKYARPHARSTVEALERRAVDERYVPGRSRNVKVNTLLSGLSSEATLLPVWMMAYRYKDQNYRFLINGQTGEPHGTKPISYRKILLIVAAVIAAIVAILICMGVMGGAAALRSERPVPGAARSESSRAATPRETAGRPVSAGRPFACQRYPSRRHILINCKLQTSRLARMPMSREPILHTNFERDEDDRDLRPQRMSEMIGQRAVAERLAIAVDAAQKRGEALGHLLLDGPPGLGKTTFALCIPRELGVNVQLTSGAALTAPKDLVPYLTNADERSVLFIDEIHRMPIAVEEYLYTAMEDFRIDIVHGEGTNARTLNIPLQPFTLIGATTRAGLLSAPLRDRFQIRQHLEFYTEEELTHIVRRSAQKLAVQIEPAATEEIARRSRGTPRVANNLLRWVRDYATSKADGRITRSITGDAMEMDGIDHLGLDRQDRKYLDTIIAIYGGGPVGIEAIAHTLNASTDTLVDEVEPFLLRTGLVTRTTRGRVVTASAYRHLKRTPPAADNATPQGNLFD